MIKMIPLIKPNLPPKEVLIPQLEKILYSGYIAEGDQVKIFEKKFADYIGNKYALCFNSGTSSLHTALILAGVKANDEVISTALTAEPTNIAILHCKAKVVWADIDYKTGNIAAESVAKKITSNTKAIVIVHYAGVPANISAFQKISKEFSIQIIEDAAHALGAKFNGKFIGNHSSYVIFSFQAIKHLTTVDGGMLAVHTKEDFDRAKLIRWFGIDKNIDRLKNDIKVIGYKYHMNNVTATIGIVQMDYIRSIIKKHIENGKYYDNALKNIPGIELLEYYKGSEPSYWLYTMKVEKREKFIKNLVRNKISASPLHSRNDRHSIFKESKTYLPNLDKFYENYVHIPCGWWVGKEDREYIVNVIKKGW